MFFEIDLNKLHNNFNKLKKEVNDIAACVKANAYGFGVKEITETLRDSGCENFCVADIFQGVEIRKLLNNNEQIICLNGFVEKYSDLYIKYNITPAVISLYQLGNIKNYNVDFWLFVDTGLNRSGISMDELMEIDINKYRIIGILSHFFNTQYNSYSEKQIEKIDFLHHRFKNLPKSFLKSSCVTLGNKYDDLARFGHSLYFKTHEDSNTENIGKLTSEIIKISYIKKNDFVGYDQSFQAENDMKIALVNCGYSYGLDSNHPYFFLNNEKCNVLGKISMDLTIIDISNIHNVKEYDQVDIFGDFLNISKKLKCSLGYLSTKINENKVKKYYIGK